MRALNAPATDCMCAFFMSVVLVEPQPIGVHVLNQLTNCNVWLIPALLGEMTSVFSYFKSPCQSEKLKASSWVINLAQKMHTKLSRKKRLQKSFCALYDQCIVPSMLLLSAVPASWDLFCCPWQNLQCRTTCQLEVAHHQRKSDWKCTEDFPLHGL